MVKIKLNWNKKYTTIAVYSLIVIAAAILFVVFIFKYDSIASGFSWIGEVLAPILIGIGIAYIINPLVCMFDNRVFAKLRDSEVKISPDVKNAEKHIAKAKKRRRSAAKALSVVCSFIIVLTVVIGIVVAVVPSVAKSVVDLAAQMPGYVDHVDAFLDEVFANNPQLANVLSEEFSDLENIVKHIAEAAEPMALLGQVSTGVMELAAGLLVTLKNVLIGLVIAIYFLFSKDRLIAQMKKVLFALFKNGKCQKIVSVCSKSNSVFKTYIVSNLLDSAIIFVLMVIGMYVMGMPYPMLIAVVCGVTNLIPFFGPFIGAIPCGLLILLVDPVKVIWFGIFVLVLQQCDGNVIKPFLFGETMGLPAIWVLISIIAGGGLFGIPGMLLGVPVFTVFYMLFSEFLSDKLRKKNLPTSTDDYFEVSQYDEDYGRSEASAEPEPNE